jgi:hypothetical protein
MIFTNSNKSLKSPEFQAVIVEAILQSCITGSYIYELIDVIERIIPSPYNTLRKYLFHLINYELISYNGQKQIYMIEDGGLDLLDWIKREKIIMAACSEDIIITIEQSSLY